MQFCRVAAMLYLSIPGARCQMPLKKKDGSAAGWRKNLQICRRLWYDMTYPHARCAVRWKGVWRGMDAHFEISPAVASLLERAVAHRRALHRIPEPGHEEVRTQAYVMSALSALSPDALSPCAGTGVRAVFRGQGGRTVAFRADMDALPVQEPAGCGFESEHPGMMHACGHDGHMACLLTLAELIASRRQMLPGDVTLLFQPAEETDGGARLMIADGALEDPHVEAVYGMHLMPDVPLGRVGTGEGPLMAQTSEIDVVIEGRASHGAMPHLGADALCAAGHFACLVQAGLSRRTDPTVPALVTFGRMCAGTQRNVLAAQAVLEGVVRTLSDDAYARVRALLEDCMRATEAAFGVACTLEERTFYPCVVNDPTETARVRALLGDAYVPQRPRMTAEDFSFYQRERPGVFVMCGCGDAAHTAPLHASGFGFDERALLYGVELFARLAGVIAPDGEH